MAYTPLPDAQKQYFVAKYGLDTNTGKSVSEPFLTIGAAITAASGDTPSSSNPIGITVLDGAIYIENLTLPSYVTLHAPLATIQGNHVVNDYSEFVVNICFASSGTIFSKTSGSGTAGIFVKSTTALVSANVLHCSAGNLNYIGHNINVTNGYGIGDATTTGEIQAKVNEVVVTGTGVGIYVDDTGQVIVTAEDLIAASGTCIEVDGTGEIFVAIAKISGSVAYDVDTGDLYIISSDISGTRTITNGGTIHFGGGQQKTILIENAGNDTLGDHRVRAVGQNASFNISFEIPDDAIAILTIKVIAVLGGTITSQSVSLTSDYGAVGEQYNNHSESQGITISATAGEITAFDVSGVFSSAVAGDHCGLTWQNNAIGQTFNYMKLELTYQT